MSVTIYTGMDEEYVHILSREPGSNFGDGSVEVDEATAKRWGTAIATYHAVQAEIRAALAAVDTAESARITGEFLDAGIQALKTRFHGKFEGAISEATHSTDEFNVAGAEVPENQIPGRVLYPDLTDGFGFGPTDEVEPH